MAIACARLGPIQLGTEQSIKIRATGESISAIGDGRLEPELADKFHSASAVQSIEDPRINNLQTDVFKLMRLKNTPEFEYNEDRDARLGQIKQLEDQGKGDMKSLVKFHLGEMWTVSKEDLRLGGVAGSVTAVLCESGATIGVTVNNFSDSKGLSLGGNYQRGDYTVYQNITKDAETAHVEESMSLVDRRVPPPVPVFLQPML